jgi:Protein of unknown function (DUF3108)
MGKKKSQVGGWQYCGVMSVAAAVPAKPKLLKPPHWRAVLVALVVVALMHAGLLGVWPEAPGPGRRAAPPQPVLARQIVRSAPLQALGPQPVRVVPKQTRPPKVLQAPKKSAPPSVQAAQEDEADSGPVMVQAPTLPPELDPAPAAVQTTLNANNPAATGTPEPEPGAERVPVFATQLPPSFTLQYRLQRGLISAGAELRWQQGDGAYTLALQTRAFGAKSLAWTSQGAVDAYGLAPVRFAEVRRGREQRAVNFQRDKGLVSFSGPQLQYPIVPGMQDRVSWMVQLAAIVAANPPLALPGAQVPMMVVGTRGDAEVWTFTVIDVTALDMPGGVVSNAVHFRREPRRAYDAQTDVWLDPARHHLPVRARLLVQPTGEGTDFVVESLSLP